MIKDCEYKKSMKGKCKMLDDYMKSNEYSDMIEKTVDRNKKMVALGKKFHNALDKLGLDFKDYNSVDCAFSEASCMERDLAYKTGFQDGVKHITECISSSREAAV